MFNQFLKWYNQLDKETLELLKRFFAKGVSTGDLNKYLKRVLRKELDNVIETP